MNHRSCLALAVVLTGGVFAGCASDKHQSDPSATSGRGMEAVYTATPVVVDGWMDEAVWSQAKGYPLSLGRDEGPESAVEEKGTVWLAWDDFYLYVAVKFEDSDIVADGVADQQPHFQLGDVCELFLRPEGQTWYWELYATPRGKKSHFWFPGRGRFGLPSNFQYQSGLRVGAQIEGTLNDWRDKDSSWTAELAMPISDLTARGESFGPGAPWRILVARYNYGRYRTRRGPELTMAPRLSETNFHLLEEYAQLRLRK